VFFAGLNVRHQFVMFAAVLKSDRQSLGRCLRSARIRRRYFVLRTILSGLTLAGLVAALIGVAAPPSSALPIMRPQTSQQVAYWHHHHWHHHRHHGGLTIRL
jgi:hypothetical protein